MAIFGMQICFQVLWWFANEKKKAYNNGLGTWAWESEKSRFTADGHHLILTVLSDPFLHSPVSSPCKVEMRRIVLTLQGVESSKPPNLYKVPVNNNLYNASYVNTSQYVTRMISCNITTLGRTCCLPHPFWMLRK